jgi:glycine/D-amino acid oxidase-like deaminating enzyme
LPDNRLLFGGRVSFSPTTAVAAGERLRKGMIGLFPQLSGIRTDYAWGGLLGVAFDFMPHAGQQDGLTYSAAYAGHGVALATYMGSQLADLLIGSVEQAPFSDLSFPSRVFYRGRPWFLPLAGLWYRLLDWAA